MAGRGLFQLALGVSRRSLNRSAFHKYTTVEISEFLKCLRHEEF
jgi:hypothetical protein